MYVILTYDFNAKRVQKALKICRRYLRWVQNSVFEGEITAAKFERLKWELSKLVKDGEDSVRFYIMSGKLFDFDSLGTSREEFFELV